MNIGRPKRTFEVEPVTLPVPEDVPRPEPTEPARAPETEPDREPAVPSR